MTTATTVQERASCGMSVLVLTVTTKAAKCLLWSRDSASSHELPPKAGATTMPISQMRKIKFPVHSHTTRRWRSWAVSPGRLAVDLYSSSGEGSKHDLIQSHPVLGRFWIKPTSSWSPKSQKFHSTELTKKWVRTSPLVQWLRIHLVMQEVRVWSLVGELRSHMLQSN